ncbi:hypothetical protein [Paraburkholderia phenoliruptrix]|uniref:Transmembrane protein n=2 Tax=Paraburkholderia phenoliruptrix TaxID=252970 RepID=K0E302_9BURK|nr:hypothetical protein [Paraburkholderia phenoliruptrix]AFT90154.1 hypothetical protein BUPH_08358 [Paraburkholderia phenoliruptrix BR3459a]CAB4053029.1 hypothetical protein LMG9964_06720 [Paraburkholderia phenoliruptrix]
MDDRRKTPSGVVDVETRNTIDEVIRDFDEIARKRYQTNIKGLAYDPDRRSARMHMRQVLGVVLKKEYSREIPRYDRSGTLIDYRWEIDEAQLDSMPDSAWQLTLLQVIASQEIGESGRDLALRLRRETLLQRAYLKGIHPWLCQSPEIRQQIKQVLKECGLGEFADFAGPKGMLKVGAAKLYTILATIFHATLPAAAIAVTAVAVCVIGLDSICRNAAKS